MRIVFLDEAIFSHSTGPTRAWSANNETIEVDEANFNMKTQALLMVVSEDRGVDHFRLYPRSVANAEYAQFLEELQEINAHQPLAVFMDNMTVHRSRLAWEKYKALNIEPIFNVPYSPQFNGIESVFSMVKADYKRRLLRQILDRDTQRRMTLISQVIQSLDPEKIRRCVQHGLNEI